MAISESGPTSTQVARNIERVRKARQLKQKDVSDRLRAVGRPMLPTVVSKVERGERRIDVDDLVSFALALNVSPLALLLPPHGASDPYIPLTDTVETTLANAWSWAMGRRALPAAPGEKASPDKQEAYELLSHSQEQRYVKRKPAGRAVDVLHDEVYRLVGISEVSSDRLDEGFEEHLNEVRTWLDRLSAEVDQTAKEHAKLSRETRQWKVEQQRSSDAGDE
ncbi:helix-turn-helix domain-containing protein [Streptomyces sp. AC512_CC834]|uniref:helix-turn-helix domain-containing protein n=1 Tax=Streptomyces sp. AC512_CC834 TaxID=2823691 RepID=UPI001C275C92|nr:helix-turn-helix transcriptional regulator [Streptomyces sp. AC512_CC834]